MTTPAAASGAAAHELRLFRGELLQPFRTGRMSLLGAGAAAESAA